jgi:hypothetical protein
MGGDELTSLTRRSLQAAILSPRSIETPFICLEPLRPIGPSGALVRFKTVTASSIVRRGSGRRAG